MYKLSKYNFEININKKIFSLDKNKDKKTQWGIGKRLGFAGITGLGSTGATYGILKILNKNKNKKYAKGLVPLITSALMGGVQGYYYPEIRNAYINYFKHKDEERLKKEINPYIRRPNYIGKKALEVGEFYKTSSWLKPITNTLSTAAKTLGSGLKFGGNPNTGEKIWRWTVKGGLGAGTAYGGYQVFGRPTSGSNYTTFLRNNLLSGNISANEVSPSDQQKVNALGMR